MRHEKIVKREDGTQYQICISAYLDLLKNDAMQYKVTIFCKQKGKRTWLHVDREIYDHEYRRLSIEKRREYDDANNLRFVTKEEIYDAKIELWNLLKPQM